MKNTSSNRALNAAELPARNVSAAILIGGQGRRMGFPKGLLRIGGRPLAIAMAELLSPLFGELFFVAEDDGMPLELVLSAGYSAYQDRIPGEGPIMGIITALERCRYPSLFVTACDLPVIDTALVAALLDAAEGRDCAVPVVGNGLHEPLFAVYAKTALRAFEAAYARGERKVQAAFQTLSVGFVNYRESGGIVNLNTPEDLRIFEDRRSAERPDLNVHPVHDGGPSRHGSPA